MCIIAEGEDATDVGYECMQLNEDASKKKRHKRNGKMRKFKLDFLIRFCRIECTSKLNEEKTFTSFFNL